MFDALSTSSLEGSVPQGVWDLTPPMTRIGTLRAFRVEVFNVTPPGANRAECEFHHWKLWMVDIERVRGHRMGSGGKGWQG